MWGLIEFKQGSYRLLNHLSDIGIEVRARSLEECFKIATEALLNIITDTDKVNSVARFKVQAAAEEVESLLVNWLNEVLYILAVESFVGSRCEVSKITFGDGRYTAQGELIGERLDRKRHTLNLEVKAATYHNLKVTQVNSSWLATVIFDV